MNKQKQTFPRPFFDLYLSTIRYISVDINTDTRACTGRVSTDVSTDVSAEASTEVSLKYR